MEPEKLQRKRVDTFGIAFVVLTMLLVSRMPRRNIDNQYDYYYNYDYFGNYRSNGHKQN